MILYIWTSNRLTIDIEYVRLLPCGRGRPEVRPHTDRPALGGAEVRGGIEDSDSGAAGDVEDHVGARVVQPTGHLSSPRWRVVWFGPVPEGGEVRGEDFHVGVDGLDAGLETGPVLLLTATRRTEKADGAGLRGRGGGDTGEEPGLLLRPLLPGDVGERVELGPS